MVGSEGVFILVLTLVGIWLIYRSLVQAESLRRHQENFLMAVTHELKTPLASMAVYLDTLESDKIPFEKKQAVVPRLRQDVARLERLVENILEAGRFDADSYRPERNRVDLSALIDTTADNFLKQNHATDIELERRFESGLMIEADRAAIVRAVTAILDNAVKYAGEDPPQIDIDLRRAGKNGVISITDRGYGLNRTELKRVFDRFYRVGSELTRNSEGTGLGLYLCRELVRAHGGEVVAKSKGLGHGATFEITLPLQGEA
jgi:signal transduction histidine kinase